MNEMTPYLPLDQQFIDDIPDGLTQEEINAIELEVEEELLSEEE